MRHTLGRGHGRWGGAKASCSHAGAHAMRGCWRHPARTGASHLAGDSWGVGALLVGAARGLQAATTQLGSSGGSGALTRDCLVAAAHMHALPQQGCCKHHQPACTSSQTTGGRHSPGRASPGRSWSRGSGRLRGPWGSSRPCPECAQAQGHGQGPGQEQGQGQGQGQGQQRQHFRGQDASRGCPHDAPTAGSREQHPQHQFPCWTSFIISFTHCPAHPVAGKEQVEGHGKQGSNEWPHAACRGGGA